MKAVAHPGQDSGAAAGSIRQAIFRNWADVLTAKGTAIDEEFRAAFGRAFEVAADEFLTAHSRDQREFETDLRAGVPLTVCDELFEIISAETLLPQSTRSRLVRAIESLRTRLYKRDGTESAFSDEPLLEGLFSDLARLVVARLAAGIKLGTGITGRAAVRKGRLDRYRELKRLSAPGIRVTNAEIARAAQVDSRDFRRWLAGELPDKSSMAERIERVLC